MDGSGWVGRNRVFAGLQCHTWSVAVPEHWQDLCGSLCPACPCGAEDGTLGMAQFCRCSTTEPHPQPCDKIVNAQIAQPPVASAFGVPCANGWFHPQCVKTHWLHLGVHLMNMLLSGSGQPLTLCRGSSCNPLGGTRRWRTWLFLCSLKVRFQKEG